jgi:ribonucleoside-diphosphate reductase beta chain
MQLDLNATQGKRVHASDKRMINATTDVNQLVPFKYKWAWDMYLAACENQWMPTEHDMRADAGQWQTNVVSQADRCAVSRALYASVFQYAQGMDSIVLGIYRHLTAPEARQYLLRQSFEEGLPSHAFSHIVEALGDIPEDTIDRSARKDFLAPYLDVLCDPKYKTGTVDTDQALLRALAVYTVTMKGLFPLVDIIQILELGQRGKMASVAAMHRLELRDLTMHCNFGVEVINAIKTENPHLWTPALRAQLTNLITQAVDIEAAYISQISPADDAKYAMFLRIVANRRANQIGLDNIYPNPGKNPFPWIGELLGLRKDDAGFEVRATETKTTETLSWD